MRGIKFGEYRCDRNEDLAAVVAQQYYIESGSDLSHVSLVNLIKNHNHFGHFFQQDKVLHMLPSIIPDSILAGSSNDKWAHMVETSFKKVF